MAGWLDDLLGMQAAGQPLPGGLLAMLGQGVGPTSGFPPNATLEQEQAAAEAARAAAAGRLARGTRRPTPFDVGAPAGPDLYGDVTSGGEPPPTPADITPAPIASSPFGGDAPGAPYMFGAGLPPMGLPPPSAYFPPTAEAAALPATSAPTAGVAPGVPPVASPNVLGTIGRNILRGLQDNSNALIAGGGAMISGGLGKGFSALAAAAPLDIAARKERQGNEAVAATYQAVLQQQLSRGVAPAEARANALAASQNPEILKTIMGPRFQHVEIKGIAGDTQIGAFDPGTGTVTVGGKPMGAADLSGPDMPHGQEYLDKYVPKNAHAIVKAAANYDVPISGMGALKQLQPYILNYDPSYDATSYAAKVALKKNYMGGGKNYEELKAFEKLGNHLNTLRERVQQLDPSDWVGVNSLRNMFSDYGKSDPKVINLRNALNAVNHELGNAYHAGHITDSTLHAFQQNLNDTMSGPGFKAGIGTMGELVHGIVTTNENAFNNALPGEKGPKEFRSLSEATRQKFRNINEWSLGVGGGGSPVATQRGITKAEYDALKPGESYIAPDGSQRTKQ